MNEAQLSTIVFCGALVIGIVIIKLIPGKVHIKERDPVEYQQATPTTDLKCLYKKYKGLLC